MNELTGRQRNDVADLIAAKGSLLREIDPRAVADLVQRILSNDCVALVGAGFSANVSPQWRVLIERTAGILEQQISGDAAILAGRYLNTGRYEAAADVLQDAAGETSFNRAVGEALRSEFSPTGRQRLDQRMALLDGIPFRGVLTTNFDGRPGGKKLDRHAYRSLLRLGRDGSTPGPTKLRMAGHAIQLHGSIDGDAGDLVVTSRQYRNLLHDSPGYRTFLRSLMATRTLLLLGKSFDDEYLNDLRSEVLALFHHSSDDAPVAFATMNASHIDDIEATYLRRHEGIEILRYGDDNDGDHAGFDALLDVLFHATDYVARTRRLLHGRNILWLDTNKAGWGHADVRNVIRDLEQGDGSIFTLVDSQTAAFEALEGRSYDLLITNWGWQANDDPVGLTVLRRVHDGRSNVPVLVFAAPGYPENRAAALRAGAADFVTTHADLYRRMYDIVDAVTPVD